MEKDAAKNRLNVDDRPKWWLVTYDMDPSFFDFSPEEQYAKETADGVHAVELAIERIWKAAYASTDFKKGWILLDLGNDSTEEDADKVMRGYPIYQYYAKTIKYTPVYSATKAGINAGIIWSGIKEYVKDHL